LDEVSDVGRSEWDEEELADDEEEDADNGHNSLQSRLIHVLQEPAPAARIATATFQLVMTWEGIGLSGTPQLGSIRGREIH
jgi:hypothetical protein